MSTNAAIFRPTAPTSTFVSLVVQGLASSNLLAGIFWDDYDISSKIGVNAELTKDGWVTTRHGWTSAAYWTAHAPAYGDAHPYYSGMGLTNARCVLHANNEIAELFYEYTAGIYGDTIGSAQQPSDELSEHGSPESVSIMLHPNFYGTSGPDAPWSAYWDFATNQFYDNTTNPNPSSATTPGYLLGVTDFMRTSLVVTCTQYFSSIPTNNPAAVGQIIDPPILNIWGTLPGDSTTLTLGYSGQWLCCDFEIGLRGQWWFRRSGHQFSAVVWPTEIYDTGSL